MIFGGKATIYYKLTVYDGSIIKDTATSDVSFNLIAFLALALICLGVIIASLTLAFKSLNKNKLLKVIPTLLFIGGGLLILMTKNSYMNAFEVNEYLLDNYSLGYGAIIACISAISAGVVNLVAAISKK
jgi:uncharacterized membrane protein YidH (DUF202 family)